ncbi:MAG: CRISPR system precrRNA processing endoribonuclease RAMP protein Cas6 [Victivallales bacterium]|nr:CRISPR system precrRNA processing endoribonuclease RAMP protein Cas6 [Victivallales bacterium]
MLTLQIQRYEFSARSPLRFHRLIPSVTLRGAFGYALAQVLARDSGVEDLSSQVMLYKHLFKPENDGNYPQVQNQDVARHYQMRGWYSRPDHCSFLLDLTLFGRGGECARLFHYVMEVMANMGVGGNRQECQCLLVSSREVQPQAPAYDGGDLAVQFVTPCNRLSYRRQCFEKEVPFAPLILRLAARLRELDALYGDGTLDIGLDWRELEERALQVGHLKVTGGRMAAERMSTRSLHVQRIGGFVGEMRYRGDFQPFLPLLAYLPYVNVGHFNEGGCGWCRMQFVKEEER